MDANDTTATGTNYTATLTEGGSPIAIADVDTSVIDVDDTNIESALITLTNPQTGDALSALDSDVSWPAGLTAVVGGGGTVVTLTGSATKAEYETAIELIRFVNTDNNPSTVDRNITVTVNDGDANSNTATSTIGVVALPDLTISNASIPESGDLVFVFTLDSPALDNIVLDLATAGVTATDGVDYENMMFEYLPEGTSTWLPAGGAGGTEVTIASGDSSVQVRINTNDDYYAEGSETMTLSVASVVSGTIDDTSDTGTGTITDEAVADEAEVSISGPASANEGDNTTNYTVSVDQVPASDITVNLSYSGTATDGTDFTGVASVIITAPSTSTTFSLATINDSLYEGAENIVIDIDSITGGGFESIAEHATNNQVTTTINDNDTPTLSVSNVAVTEESDLYAQFTLSLSNPSVEDVSVTIALGDVTASGGGVDYGTSGAGNLQVFNGSSWVDATAATISAGSTSVLARTPVTDDVFADDGEIFTLTATVTAGTTVNANAMGTGTISDEATPDVATVSLSGPPSVAEADTTTNYTLSVDFTPATDITVTLTYSGTAADGTDYTGVTPVTILAGSTSANFTLDTIDDGLYEGTENIVVSINSVTGGGFESIQAHATLNSVTTSITDNDTPTLSVSNAAVTEEVDGFAVFTVSLSNTSVEDVSFNLALSDVTATGGGTDYGASGAGNLQVFNGSSWVDANSATISAGDLSVQVRTPITDDYLADSGETFSLTATVTAGTTSNANASGTGTISDETTPDTAQVSISGPATVAEGAVTADYTVSVDQVPGTDITVNLSYSGTAIDGADFTGVASVLIAGGTTSNTFSLNTLADALAEGVESIVIDIDSISGGGFEAIAENTSANQVTTAITDDDTANWSLSGSGSVTEGSSASYSLSLSSALGAGQSANVTLTQSDVDTIAADLGLPGSNPTDWMNAIDAAVSAYSGPGSLSFNTGSGVLTYTATADGDAMTALSISLIATDDSTLEPSEDFTVSISTPGSSTGASIGLGPTTAITTTINDDDVATISIAATTDGNESGLVDGELTVSVTNPSSTDTVIDYTVAGSATSGTDYVALTGQVTILAGDTTATITVPVADDSLWSKAPKR